VPGACLSALIAFCAESLSERTGAPGLLFALLIDVAFHFLSSNTSVDAGTRSAASTVLMHQALLKAGIEAELHVWEAMPHAGFGGDTPEDREVQDRVRRFIDKHLI